MFEGFCICGFAAHVVMDAPVQLCADRPPGLALD